ncbi:Carbohydrate esterase 4 protein, partial [Physocladia obscura]
MMKLAAVLTISLTIISRIRAAAIPRETINCGNNLVLVYTDGPDPVYTPQLLTKLQTANVSAVLLFVGEKITASTAPLVLQAYQQGHAIGHMGYTNELFTEMTTSQLTSALAQASAAIKNITGQTPYYIAYPKGKYTAQIATQVIALGYQPITSNFISQDWAFPLSSDEIVMFFDYVHELEETDAATWSFISSLHGNQTGVAQITSQVISIAQNAPNLTLVNMDTCYPTSSSGPPDVEIDKCKTAGQMALVYDDVPIVGITDSILDTLDAAGVKATFCVIGSYIENNPTAAAILLRAFQNGHTICSHSYTHPEFLNYPSALIAQEITLAENAIKNVTGEKPVYWRFPYGDYDDASFAQVQAAGYYIIEWNFDPRDWFWGDVTQEFYDPTEITEYFQRILTPRKNVQIVAENSGVLASTIDSIVDSVNEARAVGR